MQNHGCAAILHKALLQCVVPEQVIAEPRYEKALGGGYRLRGLTWGLTSYCKPIDLQTQHCRYSHQSVLAFLVRPGIKQRLQADGSVARQGLACQWLLKEDGPSGALIDAPGWLLAIAETGLPLAYRTWMYTCSQEVQIFTYIMLDVGSLPSYMGCSPSEVVPRGDWPGLLPKPFPDDLEMLAEDFTARTA